MSRLEAGKYYILDLEENYVSAKPDRDRESLTPDVDGPDPEAYPSDKILKEWTIIKSTGRRYFIQHKKFAGHDVHESYAVWTHAAKSNDVTTAWRSTLYDWGWALWKIENEGRSYRISPATDDEEGKGCWVAKQSRTPIELTQAASRDDTSTLWNFQRFGAVPETRADPTAKEYATCQWLVNRGGDLRRERRYKEALETQTDALVRLRQLSMTDSGSAITKLVALSFQNRGYDLIAAKRHDDAVRAHEESVGLFKNLDMPDGMILHASALQSLAASLRALGNRELDAWRVRDEGDSMFRKLAKAYPDHVAVAMRGLAADLHSIDLDKDAERAETGARRLFSKVVATSKFLRKPVEPRLVQPTPQALPTLVVLSSLLDCLKQLAGDKLALQNKPDAEKIDSDVVTLGWACSFVTQH